MKTTRTFEMNGKTYTSMMDIARDLGVKRVYPRDFAKYGIVETTAQADDQTADQTVADDVAAPTDQNVVADKADDTKAEQKAEKAAEKKQDKKADKADKATEEKKEEDKKDEQPKVDKRFTRKLGTPEQVQEALDKAGKLDVVEFNNYIKHFSVSALEEIATTAGVKLWDDITNEPIRKMRLLMEIKAHYYPTQKTPVKPNSEWRKVGLDELLALAADKKLDYKQSSDEKIQRMWVIMALKDAGLTPQDLPKADVQPAAAVATND